MRIALCDNNNKHSKELKLFLYRYSNLYKFEFFVEQFCSGEELLQSKNKYCLIFIEYTLSGINGLETAKKIREKDSKVSIIFLSEDTHFVFESFKVSPYRFLIKPLNTQILFETMDEFFSSQISDYPLLISDGCDTFCINTDDIVYLEANNKHCYIHLREYTIHCNKTMARVFSTLPQTNFQKINRAFIVNMNYICKYNNEYVSLNTGEKIHITRNYYKTFKQDYLLFTSPKIP